MYFICQLTESDFSFIKVAKAYNLETKSFISWHTYAIRSANDRIHRAIGLKLAKTSRALVKSFLFTTIKL